MDELLATIREVQEGGKFLANWYLDRGYILLEIQSGAQIRKSPSGFDRQYFIRKNPIYVVGRPDGVAIAPRPPKRESKDEIKIED